MNNQEAIVLGVQKWMDNNTHIVERAIMKGAEAASMSVAEAVGIQISQRAAKFMYDNRTDFIAALSSQMAIGALAKERDISVTVPTGETKG